VSKIIYLACFKFASILFSHVIYFKIYLHIPEKLFSYYILSIGLLLKYYLKTARRDIRYIALGSL